MTTATYFSRYPCVELKGRNGGEAGRGGRAYWRRGVQIESESQAAW